MPSDTDEHGIPRRGSALHLAYDVNCDPEALSGAIAGANGAASIEWRSPLADQRFAEFNDRDFLVAVDRGDLAAELVLWWPESGPRWDAIGVRSEGGVVLVEAKANGGDRKQPPAERGRRAARRGLPTATRSHSRWRSRVSTSGTSARRQRVGIVGRRASGTPIAVQRAPVLLRTPRRSRRDSPTSTPPTTKPTFPPPLSNSTSSATVTFRRWVSPRSSSRRWWALTACRARCISALARRCGLTSADGFASRGACGSARG